MPLEIILVTAEWCNSCHAMENWFFTVEIPGVAFKKRDVSEVTNISGVPVILFKEHGETVQSVYGAMGKADFLGKVRSIWPEITQ